VDDGEARCSVLAREQHAQVAGTAREAGVLVLVQQEGAWPRDAVGLSQLPTAVKEQLSQPQVETFLLRGHQREGRGRTAFVAQIESGRLTTRSPASDQDLAELNPGDLVAGIDPGWSPVDSLLLVCTHSKRDRCCAELGRPIFKALAARWPERTWEVSHVGGHRFAGNLVVLPEGWFYGNLDVETALAAVEAIDEGRLLLEHLRGRSGRSAQAQYAEIVLRQHLGHDLVGGVELVAEEAGRTTLSVRGGVHLVATEKVAGPDLLLSCRDDLPKPSSHFVTREIRAL